MKIGFCGLGKLGLPVAVAIAQKFPVIGYDINPKLRCFRLYEHREAGPDGKDDFQNYFQSVCTDTLGSPSGLGFADTLKEAVSGSDIIFVAVQTPHQPQFDGSTRLPLERADFDYTYLIQAIKDIAAYVRPEQTVAVISTVLPGTMSKYILPILGNKCRVIYNPSFIAMGSVVKDFLNPEFVLLGGYVTEAFEEMKEFYKGIYGFCDGPNYPNEQCQVPIVRMSIESSELTKVAYNTFITCKIGIANTLMEICHKVPGCNVDDVTNALCKATNRLISPKYLKGASEEGGHCHPRDCIAMSWLSQQLDLSSDLFEDLMLAREWRTEWLAGMIIEESTKRFLPICILGKAFKAETNIVAGSFALLLANILKEGNVEFTQYDPYVDTIYDSDYPIFHGRPRLYFVATNHVFFANQQFPKGSVVLDLWRYLKPQEGVTIIPIGVGSVCE